ncbi:MAG: EamA family transporter [Pseudomonadales bacterium]|nr:EamA family transporter [Pseudomonadales bacterium]
MSTKKPHHFLGFFLSLTTAALWGMLPVALKELLAGMDAWTVVWYRFLVAGLVLFFWLVIRKELPNVMAVSSRTRWFLLLASAGLCINYFTFANSLNYVNGETSEAVIQLTTLFLILGGVFFYKEPFVGIQKIGTFLIVIGLVLFFHDRMAEFTSFENTQTVGVFIVIISAIAWTVYALLQKQLLSSFSSPQILLLIYVFSSLALAPFVVPSTLLSLSQLQLGLLVFCCINTLVAYGCFAEALKLWDASKVSAVLALAPLFTIGSLRIIVYFNPDYAFSDRLSWLSIFGALLLVVGSILTALMPVLAQRNKALTADSRVTAN